MDIYKADFMTIAKMGTLDQLRQKLELEDKSVYDIKDLSDSNNNSILMVSLSSRKFDVSKYLLENDAKVNIISAEGYNEFHCLSYNLRAEGALELAYMLLERGVDLDAKDNKHKNSSLWYLCHNALLRNTEAAFEFIERCFEKKPDIDSKNAIGTSIRTLIENSDRPALLKLIK
jgi:ankyrin repeat protein